MYPNTLTLAFRFILLLMRKVPGQQCRAEDQNEWVDPLDSGLRELLEGETCVSPQDASRSNREERGQSREGPRPSQDAAQPIMAARGNHRRSKGLLSLRRW